MIGEFGNPIIRLVDCQMASLTTRRRLNSRCTVTSCHRPPRAVGILRLLSSDASARTAGVKDGAVSVSANGSVRGVSSPGAARTAPRRIRPRCGWECQSLKSKTLPDVSLPFILNPANGLYSVKIATGCNQLGSMPAREPIMIVSCCLEYLKVLHIELPDDLHLLNVNCKTGDGRHHAG